MKTNKTFWIMALTLGLVLAGGLSAQSEVTGVPGTSKLIMHGSLETEQNLDSGVRYTPTRVNGTLQAYFWNPSGTVLESKTKQGPVNNGQFSLTVDPPSGDSMYSLSRIIQGLYDGATVSGSTVNGALLVIDFILQGERVRRTAISRELNAVSFITYYGEQYREYDSQTVRFVWAEGPVSITWQGSTVRLIKGWNVLNAKIHEAADGDGTYSLALENPALKWVLNE
jgi:hypothetical protein